MIDEHGMHRRDIEAVHFDERHIHRQPSAQTGAQIVDGTAEMPAVLKARVTCAPM